MIQIAIMGLGTVGTGVAKVVAENARQIERKLGEPLQVKTILVRHFKDGPYRQLMTDDFTKIEEHIYNIFLTFTHTDNTAATNSKPSLCNIWILFTRCS